MNTFMLPSYEYYHAAMAGDADAIAELEMEADRLFEEETILHLQSKKGNTEHVRFILRKFPHKNLLVKLNKYKRTALHLAIYAGHTEVAEVLIDAARQLPPLSDDDDDHPVTSFQAFLRQADYKKNTALHAAVMEGNLAIVKLLVEADPTDTHIENDKGKTPMYIAVEKGLHDIAEIISTTCTAPSLLGPRWSTLVRLKDMEQAKSPGGSLYKIMDKYALFAAAIAGDADAIAALEMHADKLLILHTVSKTGNTEHVRFILREFADKNLLVKLNKYKQTALHLALSQGHTEVAEVLINAATHLLPPSPHDDNIDDDNPVTSFQAFLRQADNSMETALHYAVKKGNVGLVKLLVEADTSDKHIQNNQGKTPMYIAVKEGLNDIAEVISTTCISPSLLGPHCSMVVRDKTFVQANSPGGTLYKIMYKDALYAAAIAGDADAIAALEMHADKLDGNDRTILHTESEEGNTEHVRFILREFAHKNLLPKLTSYNNTALHLAIYNRRTEVAEVLIDAARHFPPPSDDDDNHPATSFQAFLRQANVEKNTALHAAVMEGNLAIVKLLVEADPTDTHIQNDEGKTPMYIAVEQGNNDIVDIISTTCTAPSLLGPHSSTLVRIKNLDEAESPGRSLYEIMQKDALYAAAIAGDADATAALEMHAHKLHGCFEDTILHTESKTGNTEHVQFILREFAADKNLLVKLNRYKQTALHWALYKGYTELAEILISAARHLLPNDDNNPVTSFQAFLRQADNSMETALHFAVELGNVGLVKLIVEADPTDSHTRNSAGETPMYIAAKRGYYDIVKIICTTCTAPLDLDAPGGRTTILHTLLNDADPEKEEDRRDTIRQITETVINNYGDEQLMRNLIQLFLKRTDEKRCTILELAVERNYSDTVELILAQLDVEINQLTSNRPMCSCFMSIKPLIYKVRDKEYTNMFNSLTRTYETYERWAKPFADDVVICEMPQLISAISRRQEELAINMFMYYYHVGNYHSGKLLVTFADNLGWTALHHAAYHEFDIIIPAIVEAQNFQHPFVYRYMLSTPFHVAAAKGHTSTVICLMQSWPSCSSAYTYVDKNKQNILHLAALQSKKEMVQGILKYCSEEFKEEFVNKQDNNGDTPLHILIRRGCFIPELLRYEGLDMRVENNKRWTPPDMLYFDEEITDDQVQYKITLEGIEIDPTRDIFSNSVIPPSKRMRKDMLLNEEVKLKTDEKCARMKEDTDAISNCFADAIAGDAISKAALKIKADKVNGYGETILHVESKNGDTENVRFIVGEFANKSLLCKLDRSEQTALHLAAQHGHTQVVEVLIDAARCNLPPSSSSSSSDDDTHNPVSPFMDFIRKANVPMKNTALHLAVLNNNLAVVKLLVEADPNDSHVQNNEGKTPIYIAAENGYKDIIEKICTTCKALSLDGLGRRTTALHALLQNTGQVTEGESDMIRMIVDAAKRQSSADEQSLVEFKELFNRKDESGSTVLQLAVEKNFVEAVKLILPEDPAYQPGPEIKTYGLMCLIHKAIDDGYSNDIIELLCEAYEAGIDPKHKDVLHLILAIQRLDEGSVLCLLKDARHLVTFKEDNGWTPLHYAVYHEFDSILDALIKAQKDEGHSLVYADMESMPFYAAVKHGYTSTLVRLMELWPPANFPYTSVNNDGQNILHLAAASVSRKEMVHGILKYCPDTYKAEILNKQDIRGDTPLHILISHGCFISQLIKHKGFNTMAKNNQDLTPRDMLYVEDDIVADQVHIKIALDDVLTNQSVSKLWGKRTEKKMDIWKCNKTPPSKRKKKDGKFEEDKKILMHKKHEEMKSDLETYKTRTNTQILVTALITTVTFTVGFTMPGGLHQSGEVDEGLVVLSRKRAFNVFMVSDALALLMSVSSLFFYFLESMIEDPRQVSLLNASSTVLNILSIIGMMLTFIAGTYVVLSDTPVLAIAVCIIGSLFFLLILILWIIKTVYDRHVKRNKD